MGFWKRHIPVGVFLRSLPLASSILDPAGSYRLAGFEAVAGPILHADPLPLDRPTSVGGPDVSVVGSRSRSERGKRYAKTRAAVPRTTEMELGRWS
jgi:hypothetical protein